MLKIEKKLIDFLEKHVLVLAVILLTAIAFLMRRQAIWYHSEDYIYYFDMHEGNIQSAFYYLIVGLMGYGFEIPMHGIKWLAAIADFAVAGLVVLLCKKEMSRQVSCSTYEKGKLLLLYGGCLFAPVLYLRGCVWAQVDAVACAFLLGALYLSGRTERAAVMISILLAGMGISMYPVAMVAVLVYFGCKKAVAVARKYVVLAIILLVAVVWNGICGVLISRTWGWGVSSTFQWMSNHPYTGQIYEEPIEWLWQMLLLGGYGLALYSGVAAFRKKIPYVPAVVVQILILICYGRMLGW